MVSVRKLGKYIYVIIKKMNPLKTLTTLLKIKGKGGLILIEVRLTIRSFGAVGIGTASSITHRGSVTLKEQERAEDGECKKVGENI